MTLIKSVRGGGTWEVKDEALLKRLQAKPKEYEMVGEVPKIELSKPDEKPKKPEKSGP